MQKLLSSLAAATMLAAPLGAQSVSAGSLSNPLSVTSIDESITGSQMAGMRVTAAFEGITGTFSGFWTNLGGGSWGVVFANGQTTLGRVALGATADTYNSNYTVSLYTGNNLLSLLFEGGPSYGNVVFDRNCSNNTDQDQSPCTAFGSSGRGTAGSDIGNDFDVQYEGIPGLGGHEIAPVSASYTGAVALGMAAPVGDLWTSVFVDFSNAEINGCFIVIFGCNTSDVPDSGDSPFYFQMDTDKAIFAQSTVPEPSTYALMGAGLAAIFAARRRRRVNA